MLGDFLLFVPGLSCYSCCSRRFKYPQTVHSWNPEANGRTTGTEPLGNFKKADSFYGGNDLRKENAAPWP